MKTILVTGATGKQGGAVIRALLARNTPCRILAVTRDDESPRARSLAQTPNVELIRGNLDRPDEIFHAAGAVWGVFAVHVSEGSGVTCDTEVAQAQGLIDASLAHGVRHYVYTSVNRGADSWNSPTSVPHFQSKYRIEQYLKTRAGSAMTWSILRPVAFMDNLSPTYGTRIFLTALGDAIGDQPLQWVAANDVGHVAAHIFDYSAEFANSAVSLAGDELTIDELRKKTALGPTFSVFGRILKFLAPEMARMIDWFAAEGYHASLEESKRIHPEIMDIQAWMNDSDLRR